MAAELLVANALVCGYNGQGVHAPISLTLRERECWCLLGVNGAGKSAFLRTLVGLNAPVRGQLQYHGRALTQLGVEKRASLIAYVPQRPLIPATMTVREVLSLGAYRDPKLLEHVEPVLNRVGASAWVDRPLAALSGGEQQRVMIGRALVQGARCVVLDEPSAHLDLAQQRDIVSLLAELTQAGATVVFSSHAPDEAMRVADAVVLFGHDQVKVRPIEKLTAQDLSATYGVPICIDGVGKARRIVLA